MNYVVDMDIALQVKYTLGTWNGYVYPSCKWTTRLTAVHLRTWRHQMPFLGRSVLSGTSLCSSILCLLHVHTHTHTIHRLRSAVSPEFIGVNFSWKYAQCSDSLVSLARHSFDLNLAFSSTLCKSSPVTVKSPPSGHRSKQNTLLTVQFNSHHTIYWYIYRILACIRAEHLEAD